MPHYNEAYWKQLNVMMNDWSELVMCYEKPRRYQFGDNLFQANYLKQIGLVELFPDNPVDKRCGQMAITAVGKLVVDMSGSFSKQQPAPLASQPADTTPYDEPTHSIDTMWRDAYALLSEPDDDEYVPGDDDGDGWIDTSDVDASADKPADTITAHKPFTDEMLIRGTGAGSVPGKRALYIYPFLDGNASDSEIEASTFIAAYPEAEGGAMFSVDIPDDRIVSFTADEIRRLIAALQYALSTITD